MKYYYIILLWYITAHFPPYNEASEKCVLISHARKTPLYPNKVNCATSTFCRQKIEIANLTLPPYNQLLNISDIIIKCCQTCMKSDAITIKEYNYTYAMSNISDIMKISDFIFPFLGVHNAKTLFGWHFIPVKKAPLFYLITRKDKQVLQHLVINTLKLYPLVIVALSLAVIAGFIIWLLEKTFNEEEFPRSFLTGWFDGFWWSFISMTTVGYGDKTPRGLIARIFSVIWIMLGIAFCGIVTSSITSVLVKANDPPTPKVHGKVIMIMGYRQYDKSFVAINGGVLPGRGKKLSNETGSGIFLNDIHNLAKFLKDKLKVKIDEEDEDKDKVEVEGIILDKDTLQYALQIFKNEKNASADHKKLHNFLQHDTVRTEMVYNGEMMAYGILVKDPKHYNFCSPAILDNRIRWINKEEFSRNRNVSATSKTLLFNPKGGYFRNSMIGIFAIIGLIILIGMVYEYWRRKKDASRKPVGSADNPSLQYELKQQN